MINFELVYKWLGLLLVSGLTLIGLLLIILICISIFYGIFNPKKSNEIIKEIGKSVVEIVDYTINEEEMK